MQYVIIFSSYTYDALIENAFLQNTSSVWDLRFFEVGTIKQMVPQGWGSYISRQSVHL
jgi:hypothetical protein